MPVITPEQASEPRRRGRRALWLLLLPPGLAFGLLLAAAVQPLQIGPFVLVVATAPASGFGWGPRCLPLSIPPPLTEPIRFHGQDYLLTGEGQELDFGLGDWAFGMVWFRGHRQRPTRP